jgi:hypothetical protein
MNLDNTLAAWAIQVSLPETAADDIYRRITATPTAKPPGLAPDWWRQFSTQLAAGIVASTRPVRWAASPGNSPAR